MRDALTVLCDALPETARWRLIVRFRDGRWWGEVTIMDGERRMWSSRHGGETMREAAEYALSGYVSYVDAVRAVSGPTVRGR